MMINVLLIQNSISNYRVPVYNIIAKKCNLTVGYSEGKIPSGIEFQVKYLPVKKYHGIYVHTISLRKMAQEYDVVIGMMTYNWISNYMLAWGRHKYKFIPWGIGVPASYSVRYDDPSKKRAVFLLKQLIRRSDAVIFYADYPVQKYSQEDIDKNKFFVAHNTVNVLPSSGLVNKDSILFVGSLYKAKSSMSMLTAYLTAYKKKLSIPTLNIIGKGDEYDDISKWIEENGLNSKVKLLGAIYDEIILRDYFEKAFACISLGQAGLSVQKSMGYGVPFITTYNAYTGGERLDIIDNKNGILLEDEEDLTEVLIDITNTPDKYKILGEEAKRFYYEKRTIENMAAGVINAINYVMKYDE